MTAEQRKTIEEQIKDYGCKHPEDSWTNYWCGDCGEYCKKCGCIGPRAKK